MYNVKCFHYMNSEFRILPCWCHRVHSMFAFGFGDFALFPFWHRNDHRHQSCMVGLDVLDMLWLTRNHQCKCYLIIFPLEWEVDVVFELHDLCAGESHHSSTGVQAVGKSSLPMVCEIGFSKTPDVAGKDCALTFPDKPT